MDTTNIKSRYDAVIVGSGHNGLVAAAYLAKAGKSVLVLEKNATLGGATTSKKVFPDYDAYLSSYSYLVSLFPQKIIDDLGLRFKTKQRQTASFTPYVSQSGLNAGLVMSNIDPHRSQRSLCELAGNEQAWSDYQRFLDLELAIAAKVWPSMLEPLRSKREFSGQMMSPLEIEAWKSFVEEPLGNVIERYSQSDVLRGLLMTDAKIGVFTEPHDATLLQNRCFLYHVVGGGNGEWRVPVGGMRSLVNSLCEVCTGHNVDFLTSAEVVSVGLGSVVHEVRFELEDKACSVEAEYVLVNSGPKSFARILGTKWQANESDEGSVIKINMLLKRLPKVRAKGITSEEAFSGSFHIDEGYAQMQSSYRTASIGNIPKPAPGEIYCHTLTDPSILSEGLRQQGFQTLTLFGLDMPYRLFETDHDARRDKVLQLYLDGLDRVCDEPFRDCLALNKDGQPCVEIKTPQDLENEIDLDQGNIFHNAPSWFYAEDSNEIGKWGVETELPRVYRAGSSATRGGAVSGIPGHNAAMCVLGRLV